ncbi:2'-5' RNA ligase family protein [Microbacterium sp.]|uniref:2'-5' RNA ligase family protein n=1 Tax=Microbacterium sp. TaxID=51671 RepID=UPI0039E2DDB3
MRRFFDRDDTKWRRLDGALHFYVCPPPGDALFAAYEAAARSLEPIEELAVQPAEYLHMTMQRLDAYPDEIGGDAWATALGRIGESVAALEPFDVEFEAPRANTHAVEAVGAPSASWAALLDGLRRAFLSAGLGDVLMAPPYGPHYTVAYCLDDTAAEPVSRALQRAARRSSMRVDRVSLVAVDQRPEQGIFTFDTLREWTLDG